MRGNRIIQGLQCGVQPRGVSQHHLLQCPQNRICPSSTFSKHWYPALTFSGSPSSHPSQSQVPSIAPVLTSPPTTIEPVTLPTSSSPTIIDPPTHISFHWIDEYGSSDDTQSTAPAAAPTKTQGGTIPILQPSAVPVPSSRPVLTTLYTPGQQEKFSTPPTKNDEDPISINFEPSIPTSSSFSSFSTYYHIVSSVSWGCFVLAFVEML